MPKTSKPSPQPSSSRREAEREALIEEAMRNPGVAEAVKAYGDLERYRVATLVPAPKPQFATDANS